MYAYFISTPSSGEVISGKTPHFVSIDMESFEDVEISDVFVLKILDIYENFG